MTTREVSTQADFMAAYEALTRGQGGTILLRPREDGSGHYSLVSGKVDAYDDKRIDAPVTIRSLDPLDLATFDQIRILNKESLTLRDVRTVEVDKPEGYGTPFVVNVSLSHDVALDNVDHQGLAEGIWDREGARALGFMTIVDSSHVSLTNSSARDFYNGLVVAHSNDIVVADNELTRFQGDASFWKGNQNVLIEGNHFHNPHGADQLKTHSDMVQLTALGALEPTRSFTIRENFFTTGSGPGYQMIFGRNGYDTLSAQEAGKSLADRGLDPNGEPWVFEGLVIEHNVLHAASLHMISVSHSQGAVVRNNTTLFNSATRVVQGEDVDQPGVQGWVGFQGDPAAIVEGNVAVHYGASTDLDGGKNTTIDYDDDFSIGHVDAHLVNPRSAGTSDLRDLMFRAESPWNGAYGSKLSWWTENAASLTATAQVVRSPLDFSVARFDASLSRDESGRLTEDDALFVWHFDDGTIRQGLRVEHDFGGHGLRSYSLTVVRADGASDTIERTVRLKDPELLNVEAKVGQVLDTSEYKAPVELLHTARAEENAIVFDGVIADSATRSNGLRVGTYSEHLFQSERFNLALTLDPAEGSYGRFLYVHQNMIAHLLQDGRVQVSLATDESGLLSNGTPRLVSVTTRTPAFGARDGVAEGSDWSARHLNFVYDSETLSIYVDGALAGQTALSGATLASTRGIVFGTAFAPGLSGRMSDITMSTDVLDPVSVANAYATLVGPAGDGAPAAPRTVVLDMALDGDLEDVASGVAPSERGKVGFAFDDGAATLDGALVLDPSSGLVFPRADTPWMFGLRDFEIGFGIDARADGRVLTLTKTLQADVRDGAILFKLTTDEGVFTVGTPTGTLTAGEERPIALSYSDEDGVLRIGVDGETVAEVAASGQTAPELYWNLIVGSAYNGNGFTGRLDDLRIATADPVLPAPGEPAPVAADDAVTLDETSVRIVEGTGVASLSYAALTKNDFASSLSSVQIDAGPLQGQLAPDPAGTGFLYSFELDGFTGADAFAYRVATKGGVSEPAQVAMKVWAPPPEALPDTVSMIEAEIAADHATGVGQAVIGIERLLGNDRAGADARLELVSRPYPDGFEVTFDEGAARIDFALDTLWDGQGSFDYRIVDRFGESAAATVTLDLDLPRTDPVKPTEPVAATAPEDEVVMNEGFSLLLDA